MASASRTLFIALSRLLALFFLIHVSQSCPNTIQFNCPDYVDYTGKKTLDYPFSTGGDLPDCGVCLLTCEDNQTMISFIGYPESTYRVLDMIPSNNTIVAASGQDHADSPCHPIFPKLPSVSFKFLDGFDTIVSCPNETQFLNWDNHTCKDDDDAPRITYGPYNDSVYPQKLPPLPHNCSSIQLPHPEVNFSIQYNLSTQCMRCVAHGGRCHDDFSGEFYCYHKKGNTLKVIIYSVVAGLTATIFILTLYWQRRKVKGSSIFLSRKESIRENKNFETILENYAHLTPKRYTHTNIKKMTNSFKEKLGEGGFGGVYKGKLLDGRLVAVKLLKNSKGHREGFINEVASIGRTNHINIVTLLGYCNEGHKRALVYEYMANGSLEKFMHCEGNNGHSLPLETLFQIVLGIARGLEYLHRGCKTRILHFDIKPHNILLDEEFCPKISDFGLAKLTPQDKRSKVSMSGTRGTIGYIAPEVFCRTFGDVSHKSDVYSFGMMVLEVIGSRRKVNSQVKNSSDLYFPQYVYKQLEQGDEVETDNTMNENEKQLKRKMIVVSLWCTQPAPSSRPSMTTVVQMLEGSSESTDIPPLPTFSSPPRLQWEPSTSSITTDSQDF